MIDDRDTTTSIDFEGLVNAHYQPLYRFAFSLSHSEAQAWPATLPARDPEHSLSVTPGMARRKGIAASCRTAIEMSSVWLK